MKIDLKWTLPFVMPFVLVATTRGVYWAAGAALSPIGTAMMAILSLCAGIGFGVFFVVVMIKDDICWTITIGKRGRE